MVEKKPTLAERVKAEFYENRQERKEIGVLTIGGDLAIEDGVAKFFEYNGQTSFDPENPYEQKNDHIESEKHKEERTTGCTRQNHHFG